MRPIQVKRLDQGHTVSLSVSDSAFKPRLSAPGSYLTLHARRTSGSWPGGMGSGALQGEGVTGTGCGDDRELGAVRTHRGSVWLDERWGCTEGQGPIRKPFLAMSGIWILSDDSRRKVLKSFKREGVMTGFVLLKGPPWSQSEQWSRGWGDQGREMAVGGASEVVYLPHARVLELKEGAPL